MKKAIVLLTIGLFVCSSFCMLGADADDFEVVWLVDIPREIYFIGETVTITIVAYASTDSTLYIPGEMCMVSIRNESLSEQFSAWLTTDSNGTTSASWDIPLNADTGNYTFVLAPIGSDNIIMSFTVLFDENTYWQKRVENLEDELAQQYEYLNYLYATSNYLKRQVSILKSQVFIAGAVMFITIMTTLGVIFPIWAQRSNLPDMRNSMSSKFAKLMGFSNTPKVLLTDQHEELAQLKTPPDRRPPRYGMIYHCSICDPDKKEPMTRFAYDSHLDSHNHRQYNLRARRRNRVYKQIIKDHYKIEEDKPDVEKEVLIDKRKNELIDSVELSKKELKAIAAEKKRLLKEENEKGKKQKKERRFFKRKPKEISELPEVLKETPSPNTVSQRKVRGLKHKKTVPEKPKKVLEKPLTKSTPIDDLFERLSNEKVD